MTSLVVSAEAEADAYEVWEYLAKDSEQAADLWNTKLYEQLNGLDAFPASGTPRDDLRPGLRSTPFKQRWIIFYQVEARQVRVLRMIVGERDFGPGDFSTL